MNHEVVSDCEIAPRRYGNDFIDIEIWDSREAWAKEPLWDKYANAGNIEMAKTIDKEFAQHLLVKVFYNPKFQSAATDFIEWTADDRTY